MGDTNIDSDLATPVDLTEPGGAPSLVVSEIFGPTCQGEGPSCGRRAMFVRLGRCNLDCAWCDTPYTWDWSGKNGTKYDPKIETYRVSAYELAYELAPFNVHDPLRPGLVVITGGEPMLQLRGLQALAAELADQGIDIEIETNGTRRPPVQLTAWARFNVSPKLPHSGVSRERAIIPDAMLDFAALAYDGRASFKYVVQDVGDLDLVDVLRDEFAIPAAATWIMPQGRSVGDVQARGAAIADAVIARGYNITPRLHVELWGDERGR